MHFYHALYGYKLRKNDEQPLKANLIYQLLTEDIDRIPVI